MTPSPPPRTLTCPGCTRPLRSLRLPGHYEREVEIDLCGPCRLAWFDERESMQLSGLGWIGLLEQLNEAQPALQPWSGQSLGCPRCRGLLRLQHNQTRWGLFVAQACPQRHGTLQNHATLLAERGLLRTPSAADREAMASVRWPWTCLNCGAPVAGASSNECAFCRTPLLLFDLERLAVALLPQPLEHATVSAGRLDVWPCQGCGFALDPTRRQNCPQCGQIVLARSLADLGPLLSRLRETWQAWLARRTPAASDPATDALRAARARPNWLQAWARRRRPPEPAPSRTMTWWQIGVAVVLLLIWWSLYR